MTYTASDGTQFEDRNEWRKYEFETNYTFKNKQNESLMKVPGNIDGQPFDIADLTGCEVMLLDHSDQIQIDNLSGCRVFIGPSSESVFVRNCTDCTFTIACKQLRTRDCGQCNFYLYSQTDPIIETSSGMNFAPFNGSYNGLPQHFASANLDPTNNHWSRVYDFNDPDKSGKNWSILPMEQEMQPWVINLESMLPGIEQSFGPPTNPVARDAQATIYDDDGNAAGVQSFSFDTTQEQAQTVVDELGQTEPPVMADPFAAPPAPTPDMPAQDPFGAPPVPVMQSEDPFGAPAAPMPTEVAANPLAEPLPETWPKLEAFEAEWQKRIEEKQMKEDQLVRDIKKQAEKSLDQYYGERTDRLAHRAATNREQEVDKKEALVQLKDKAIEQPWTRVIDLVNTKAAQATKKSEDSSTPKQQKEEKGDISRMKSILVQLKNAGGLEVNQA